jgi:omega-6 fatty acid desaturase (delta-12 desaturase)
MDRDQVFLPHLRSDVEQELQAFVNPKFKDDPDHQNHFKVAPLYTLLKMAMMLLFGWPAYLLYHASGPSYSKFTSHFLPNSPIFDADQRKLVVLSDVGVLATLGALSYASMTFGLWTVVKFYVVPYLFVNFWLVTITFLQHTDVQLPQ